MTCQEIGHDYGLGHQDEDFSTDATSSCMEYTSIPAGNEHPDAHDYNQLLSVYNHIDSAAAAAPSKNDAFAGRDRSYAARTGAGRSATTRSSATSAMATRSSPTCSSSSIRTARTRDVRPPGRALRTDPSGPARPEGFFFAFIDALIGMIVAIDLFRIKYAGRRQVSGSRGHSALCVSPPERRSR